MTEMTGVITPRRRGRTSRQTGWEEFGHIPGAVRAALHLLSTTTTVTTSTTAKRVDCLSSEGVVEGDIVINNNDNISNNEVEPNATVTYDDDDDDAILRYAITLLSQACRLNDMNESSDETNGNHKRKDIPVSAAMTYQQGHRMSHPHPIPTWLPTKPGEQLCNLVGHWRILQRKASHRWTTDDIVTAYVAASTFVSSLFTRKNYRDDGDTSITDEGGEDNGIQKIRYLDLGTGNASVLQMVTWYLLSSSSSSPKSRGCMTKTQMQLKAVGVEARSEAVNLARRSLSFNLGAVELDDTKYCGGVVGIEDSVDETMVDSKECNVQIVQGDFRDLVSLADASTKNEESNAQDGLMSMADVASKRYDLITGTPPYFRVGFTTTSTTQDKGFERTTDDNLEVVTSAVIEQGGMPTSMQSAPARCEFRGGIEAYCLAASALLSSPHGIFVVCENWANDDRVWKGAAEAGLIIESVLPVCGGGKAKQRQGNNILFAVYVMKKKIEEDALAAEDRNRDVDEVEAMKNCMQHTLVVRDENGKWTEEYAKVMNSMSIPTE